MAYFGASAAFVCIILALFVQNGSAIRCWTCSSDLDPHCGDPFNATNPLNTHRYTLTDCDATNTGAGSYPYLSQSRSVCKKVKQLVNGELTIIRACAWKQYEQVAGTCPTTTTPNFIKMTFCETCDYDACNGAEVSVKKSIFITVMPLLSALLLRK